MGVRFAVLASVLVLSACEAVTVEGGGAPTVTGVTARTCLGSVAASLDLDRKTLAVTAAQSLPEGDMITISTADGDVRCYTDLSGKVVSIQNVPPPPPAPAA